MTFDDNINKILQEAYFNSPYEKATGIKRQVAIQQEDESEFRETKDRKTKTLIFAADAVISYYEASVEEGEPMNKKELAEFSIQKLAELEDRMQGDEYNLDDMNNYFKAIGKFTTGKAPMTAERYRNIEKQAKKKMYELVKKAETEGPAQDDQDTEEQPAKVAPNPDKLSGFAKAKALAQGIDFTKYMEKLPN